MMDGKNSAGLKVSLLVDSKCSSDVAQPKPTIPSSGLCQPQTSHHHPHQHRTQQRPSISQLHQAHGFYSNQLPPLLAHSHSRSSSSSCATTPCLSPQTPQLIRSDSSDSRTFAQESPLTPLYGSFDQPSSHRTESSSQLTTVAFLSTTSSGRALKPVPHLHFVANTPLASSSSSKMDDPINSLYPPLGDALAAMPSAYPMPPQMTQQLPLQDPTAAMYRSSNSPASEPSRVSTVSAASTTNAANNKAAAPKKNQYPCPMAKQYNCNDFFTTSGHAARHAKKHTGKKDAFCPECNKAFTRKDNMEQHRRTHQNGRGTGRSSDDKVKKPTKAPTKKAALAKAEPLLEAAVEQQLAQQARDEQELVVAAQLQAVAQAQAQAQQQLQVDALIPSPTGPYFLGTLDPGPIPSLPMPAMNDISVRPQLHRSNLTTSLDYIPPLLGPLDPITDGLNYSYPSPGLSHGLNSLALAASEHRRLSEEKARTPPSEPSETPNESP